MTTVAFVGLGAMGRPIAGHLAGRFPTLVANRTHARAVEHAAQFGSRAVDLADDPAAFAEADVVLVCLPVSADVDAVVDVLAPHLRPGAVLVDHTSGEPEAARATAARLDGLGVTYLDACLSGGVPGAVAGRATVMFGGPEDAVDRVREVVGVYASTMVRVGDVGAGHAVKAVNNALLAVNLWALGEGLLALVRQGVDPALALEVVNASSGRSNASENLVPQRVVTGEFTNTFALGLLDKDLGIAAGVLDDARTPAPVLRQVRELVAVAASQVGRDVDHTALVRLLEQWAGTQIRSPRAG